MGKHTTGDDKRTEFTVERDNLRMILEHMSEHGGQLTIFCHVDAEGSDINSRWGGGYHFGSETDIDGEGDPGLAAGAAYGMGHSPNWVLHQIADELGMS